MNVKMNTIRLCMLSLIFLGAGVYLFVDSLGSFQERGASLVFTVPGSLFFLGFGLLGLRNALQFKRNRSPR